MTLTRPPLAAVHDLCRAIARQKNATVVRVPSSAHRFATCFDSAVLFHTTAFARQQQQRRPESRTKEIDILRERPFKDLPFGEKVKQTGKDATYLTVVVVGFGVTGLMFYFIGRELLSSESPNGVYASAVKKCQNNDEVADALGKPIKSYGEMTRRGRRQYPSYMEFSIGSRQAMRMKFYLEGTSRHATVHLEVRKNDSGKYEYEYLVVELDDYGKRQIVVERRSDAAPAGQLTSPYS